MNIYLNDETGEWITEEEYESGPDLYEGYVMIDLLESSVIEAGISRLVADYIYYGEIY